MPQRLPVVTQDAGAWGTILNGFLGVAHNADGSLTIGPAVPATLQTLVAGATITLPSGMSIARVTETANVGTIKMASGAFGGQLIVVVNEANFTVTFDVQANSKVADGATSVIAGLVGAAFIWNDATLLWYRLQ